MSPEQLAKRLGGKACIDGKLIWGQDLIDYLEAMPVTDQDSLIADLIILEYLEYEDQNRPK